MTAQPLASDQQAHLRAVPTQSADDTVFEALYSEHFDRLRRFVLGLTGQAALAEDVAQETLLRAYVRMDTIDFDRPLWPWLKCVAVRLIVDNSRVQRRESLDPDPAVESPIDTFDVTVERQLLSDALRSLPPRQRIALGLRYLENWKSAEVAAVLGMSRVAVEQLLLRGRRRLSAEYLALGGEATGWRVALWPLLFVLSRLRDRTAKMRQAFGGSTAQMSLTIEGATNMVAVVAMGSMFVAAGAALAAPAPAEVAGRVEAAHASVFHAPDVRAEAVPWRAVADAPARTSVAPREATREQAPAAASAASTAGSAPASDTRVTRVGVAAPAAIKDAPASPVASASGTRTQEKALVRGSISVRAGNNVPAVHAKVEVLCSGGAVTQAGCAAYDTADGAAPLP